MDNFICIILLLIYAIVTSSSLAIRWQLFSEPVQRKAFGFGNKSCSEVPLFLLLFGKWVRRNDDGFRLMNNYSVLLKNFVFVYARNESTSIYEN